MKKSTSLFVFLASALATSAFAAEDCKNPRSQAAMNACAGTDYQREDAVLNAKYKELTAKLQKDRREKLKAVQLVWIKYRDMQCDFNAATYDGGSMYSMVRDSCLLQMTKQRNKDVKAMLDDASM